MLQRRRLSYRKTKPVTAALLATALVGASVVGIGTNKILKTQGTAIEPVTASLATENLAQGKSIVVDDAAVTAQGAENTGSRTVKEFTRDQQFSQFAMTWNGDKDIAAFFRGKRADGTWTSWFNAEPMDLGPNNPNGKRGTDLIYIEPTNTVQVFVLGADLVSNAVADAKDAAAEVAPEATKKVEKGVETVEKAVQDTTKSVTGDKNSSTGKESASTSIPTNFGDITPVADTEDTSSTAAPASDFDVVFVDGGESQLPANGIDLAADSDGMPRVISRAGWGADESLRCSSPEYDDGTSAITIHHTAGSNNYTEAQAPGIVRGVYQYHAQTLGWCDVGYQSLADKYGNLYEGRYGGLNKSVHGAHAGGFNTNTWAISMLGNYDTVETTPVMINAVGELAGWRSHLAGFDPTGSSTHTSEGSSYTFYPYGKQVTLPNIFAHRDVGTTSCPGKYGYAQMDNIRAIAKKKYDALSKGGLFSFPNKDNTATTTPSSTATNSTATDSTATTAATTAETTAPTTLPASMPSDDKNIDILGTLTTAGEMLTTLNDASKSSDVTTHLQAGISLLKVALDSLQNDELPVTYEGNGSTFPVIKDLKMSDLQPVIAAVGRALQDPNFSIYATNVNASSNNALGVPRSEPSTYTNADGQKVTYALFENGILLDTDATGPVALWGKIADAWASQGFDGGPLGLPVSQPRSMGNNITRADFENGYITHNTSTGAVDIHPTA